MAASRAQLKPPAAQTCMRMRRHACEWPWAPAQIVAVSIVVLSVVVFYAFSVQELPSYLQRIVLLLVSAQVVMVVLLFVSITLLDPAHPAVIQRRMEDRQPSIASATQSPDDSTDLEGDHLNADGNSTIHMHTAASDAAVASPTRTTTSSSSHGRLQCSLCDVAVSTGTRHCSVCRKCVAGFDHHCVYLNTCIGSRNYPLFIALLACSIALVATQLVLACFAVDRLHHRGATSRAVLVGALCVLPLLQLVSMLVLALFHSYISCKGLKTYQWLQQFSQQQSAKYTAKTPTWHQSHQATRQLGRLDDELDSDDFSEPSSHATPV